VPADRRRIDDRDLGDDPGGLGVTAPPTNPVADWTGPYRSYDLLKEIVVAVVVFTMLTAVLALAFGSPSREAVTFEEWSNADPVGFVATTLDELTGDSGTGGYGPPYNATSGAAQSLFGVSPASIVGVRIPVDTSQDMVLRPLGRIATAGSDLADAIDEYRTATGAQRSTWTGNLAAAVGNATASNSTVDLPDGDYGPVAPMLSGMLSLAQSGAVDAALIDDVPEGPGFFVMDYTRSQLFLADGDYLSSLGEGYGLAGDQWGMAATIGNWPGQVWLLPVSFWYQIPPGSTSDNGDIIVLAIVGVLGLLLVFLPFIPGLRSIPARLGVYRLIWRDYYRSQPQPDPGGDRTT
jgi:hypothetical protein